jgi:hypothetical protein
MYIGSAHIPANTWYLYNYNVGYRSKPKICVDVEFAQYMLVR